MMNKNALAVVIDIGGANTVYGLVDHLSLEKLKNFLAESFSK